MIAQWLLLFEIRIQHRIKIEQIQVTFVCFHHFDSWKEYTTHMCIIMALIEWFSLFVVVVLVFTLWNKPPFWKRHTQTQTHIITPPRRMEKTFWFDKSMCKKSWIWIFHLIRDKWLLWFCIGKNVYIYLLVHCK